MNILHIEQSKMIREMMSDMVSGIGHGYLSAVSGQDAFGLMDTQKVQLIITGLELGDMSGETFMTRLLQSGHRDVPVVVLTSTDCLEVREKLFDLGVVDYIVKESITNEKLKNFVDAFEVKNDVISKIQNRSIAVLDDSPLVNTLIRNIFDLHGIRNVDIFTNAVDLLKSEKQYAIYILDLILPGISGEEVLLELRKKAENSVIILMSSVTNYKTISDILSSGADDFIMKPFDASVFMARIKAHSRNFILREELERANKALERLAVTDGLTEIYNHRYIVKRVEDEIERSKRYGNPLSILLFDIDNFKRINDTYGHIFGDEVLRSISMRVRSILRYSDAVGRYGGEEFLVVLPETDAGMLKIVGEKICRGIETMTYSRPGVSVTVSGGGVVFDKHSPIELIRCADQALYQAKGNGKNRIEYFE